MQYGCKAVGTGAAGVALALFAIDFKNLFDASCLPCTMIVCPANMGDCLPRKCDTVPRKCDIVGRGSIFVSETRNGRSGRVGSVDPVLILVTPRHDLYNWTTV